MTGIKNRQEEN